MPQWYPAMPRRPFRERTTKLWIALVTGLACLIVGLGVGIAIGQAAGDDDDRGPGRFRRFPDGGPGFSQRDGQRDGRRFGWGNRPGASNGPGDLQQSPQPQSSPSASPSASPGATG
jgi:hypothetical protein